MSEESIIDEDLGEATIVYEHPEEGTVEQHLNNEHVAYFQDHWIIKSGEDEQGNDLVRRIPHTRVHYVERSVGRFEDEIATLRDQVQSFAGDLRSRLLGGGSRRGGEGPSEGGADDEPDVLHIDVESGEPDERGESSN